MKERRGARAAQTGESKWSEVATKLERRLRQIEDRLKPRPRGPKDEPHYMDLLDFPKEMVIATLGILKDAGGYQLMLRPEQLEVANEEEPNALNKLTPGQFYDLMVTQRSAGVGQQEGK